jgi:hypothetical protein
MQISAALYKSRKCTELNISATIYKFISVKISGSNNWCGWNQLKLTFHFFIPVREKKNILSINKESKCNGRGII